MNTRQPPTLLVRTLTATVIGVALLLSLIFVILSASTRRQVRESAIATLESSDRIVSELGAMRQQQLLAHVALLVERPALRAALEGDAPGATFTHAEDRPDSQTAVHRDLTALATSLESDALVLVDRDRRTVASAGPTAGDWPQGAHSALDVRPSTSGSQEGTLDVGGRHYHTVWVDVIVENTVIGALYASTALSDGYAARLSRFSNAQIAIVANGRTIASTLAARERDEFDRTVAEAGSADGSVSVNGESIAFRKIAVLGHASLYALSSIDRLSRRAMTGTLGTLALVALGALAFSLAASIWLAHMIARPIGQLSASIEALASTRDLRNQLAPSGTSRELDQLTETFNQLMGSVASAESATDAAYTGAIRALAAALDARDPYTSGHSERVSTISVAIGQTLRLSDADLEILRLGALLHDIGKIGVSDAVLLKPGPLTDAEQRQIMQHPVLGARILRSVPFLAPHLSIVELHHERPDGRGYPYGLRTHATPLAARIVHVADAYDAMTSARAYRTGRSDAAAIAELRRCAGTEFDEDIVEALIRSHRDLAKLDALDATEPMLVDIA